MKITDVTDRVDFGNIYEYLPMLKCVCGERFDGWGDFVIDVYKDWPHECPKCGAKLYFTMKINVYQVEEEN